MNELAGLFDRYKNIVVFDTETTGLNFENDQIIELAAIKLVKDERGKVITVREVDEFIKLPDGQKLDEYETHRKNNAKCKEHKAQTLQHVLKHIHGFFLLCLF